MQDQPSVRGSSSASMQIPNLYEIAVPPQSSSARCYSIAPACTTAVTAAEAINEQREGGVCEGRPRYPGLMNDVDLEAGTTVV